MYPLSTSPPDVTVRIEVGQNNLGDSIAHNLFYHEELPNGFRCRFGRIVVSWTTTLGHLTVNVRIGRPAKSIPRKLVSIDFTHPFERIGAILHELALIPTLFFFPDELFVVHSSALETQNGNAVLFTGTGGVGKTTIEAQLVYSGGYKYLSDDMSLISSNGYVWPNYAFPKIYSYNVLGDSHLGARVMKGRGLIDKIQWVLRGRLIHCRVRRRINPIVLSRDGVSSGARLGCVFVLFRGNFTDVSIEPICAESLSEMCLYILSCEYSVFFKHLCWHRYNCLAVGRDEIINVGYVLDCWRALHVRLFDRVPCHLVRIPMRINVNDLVEVVRRYLNTSGLVD